jgi:hypothetical protein
MHHRKAATKGADAIIFELHRSTLALTVRAFVAARQRPGRPICSSLDFHGPRIT